MTTKEEIKDVAAEFLLMNYGNCLYPGEPVFETKYGMKIWKVPINYGADGDVNFPMELELVFNEKGRLILVPRDEEIDEIIGKKFEDQEIKTKIENYGKLASEVK